VKGRKEAFSVSRSRFEAKIGSNLLLRTLPSLTITNHVGEEQKAS